VFHAYRSSWRLHVQSVISFLLVIIKNIRYETENSHYAKTKGNKPNQTKPRSSLIISRNARTRQLQHLDFNLRLLHLRNLPLMTHPNRPARMIALERLPFTPAATAVQPFRDRQRQHIRDCECHGRRRRRGADAETRLLAHGDGGWQEDSEFGFASLDQRAV
jgi:hypothetical protein